MRIFVCAALALVIAMTAAAADVTGKWSGSFTPEGQQPSSAYMVLKQAGTTLTGTGGPDADQQWPITDGKVSGNKVTGSVTAPDGTVYKLDITVNGDNATGVITATREGQNMVA